MTQVRTFGRTRGGSEVWPKILAQAKNQYAIQSASQVETMAILAYDGSEEVNTRVATIQPPAT